MCGPSQTLRCLGAGARPLPHASRPAPARSPCWHFCHASCPAPAALLAVSVMPHALPQPNSRVILLAILSTTPSLTPTRSPSATVPAAVCALCRGSSSLRLRGASVTRPERRCSHGDAAAVEAAAVPAAEAGRGLGTSTGVRAAPKAAAVS